MGKGTNNMGITELILLAVGLAMDAFAVSICKGLAAPRITLRQMAIAGLWFGGFQALMPVIGYWLGSAFQQYITAVDHWIAFLLLAFIGGRMIKEALSKDEAPENGSFGFRLMFLLAVATSIDALAVGITLALLPGVHIGWAAACIGVITFVFAAAGVKIGHVFGARYKSKAELAGGIILILMGLKIWLEHMGFWPF